MARRTKDGHWPEGSSPPAIYDGATRGEAAKIGGVTLQIVATGFFVSTPTARMALSIARRRDSRRF